MPTATATSTPDPAISGAGFPELAPGGYAQDIAVAGNYAYLAVRQTGLHIIDISNPGAPFGVGIFNPTGNARAIAVKDGFAYVAADSRGLRIIDVSDPARPEQVGFYENTDGGSPVVALAVTISGHHAYVAADGLGLIIVDISDPTRPSEVGLFRTPIKSRGQAGGIAVDGSLAYVAYGEDGLRIIDVSNPRNLVQASSHPISGIARNVSVANGLAFVASNKAGLTILDVSNPARPWELSLYDTTGVAFGVDTVGSHVYVADGLAGLRVIDVSSPERPRESSFFDTPGDSRAVTVVGNYAYLAEGGDFLRIIDVSNQSFVRQVGFFDTPGLDALRQQMVQLINQAREQNGLTAVVWDGEAAKVGQVHAEDMAQYSYFSHWDRFGRSPAVRNSRLGGTASVRENLFRFFHRDSTGRGIPVTDWPALIERAHNALMSSPTHRAAILDPAITGIGLGLAQNMQTGEVRVVQEFVHRYVEMTLLPQDGPLNGQFRLAGQLLAGSENPVINLGYEPFPALRSIDELNATSDYTSTAKVYMSAPVALLPNGVFSAKVILNHEDRAGFYHIQIVVGFQGHQIQALDAVVEVGR